MTQENLFSELGHDAVSERVLDLARSGLCVAEVSRETGLSKDRVKRICDVAGVQLVSKQIETGMANQAEYNRRVSSGEIASRTIKHGAFSKVVAPAERVQLAEVRRRLVDHFGWPEVVTTPQELVIDRFLEKLLVIERIGKYVDRLLGDGEDIISADGKLIACLGQNYLSYSEAARRDLQSLRDLGETKGPKLPTISDILSGEIE